jgi:hypothetical protein
LSEDSRYVTLQLQGKENLIKVKKDSKTLAKTARYSTYFNVGIDNVPALPDHLHSDYFPQRLSPPTLQTSAELKSKAFSSQQSYKALTSPNQVKERTAEVFFDLLIKVFFYLFNSLVFFFPNQPRNWRGQSFVKSTVKSDMYEKLLGGGGAKAPQLRGPWYFFLSGLQGRDNLMEGSPSRIEWKDTVPKNSRFHHQRFMPLRKVGDILPGCQYLGTMALRREETAYQLP